jgi:hypothetical protein
VKCGYVRKVTRSFYCKFQILQFHTENCPFKYTLKKVDSIVIEKKRKQRHRVLTEEKLDEIIARLEKSLRCLAQKTRVY